MKIYSILLDTDIEKLSCNKGLYSLVISDKVIATDDKVLLTNCNDVYNLTPDNSLLMVFLQISLMKTLTLWN